MFATIAPVLAGLGLFFCGVHFIAVRRGPRVNASVTVGAPRSRAGRVRPRIPD